MPDQPAPTSDHDTISDSAPAAGAGGSGQAALDAFASVDELLAEVASDLTGGAAEVTPAADQPGAELDAALQSAADELANSQTPVHPPQVVAADEPEAAEAEDAAFLNVTDATQALQQVQEEVESLREEADAAATVSKDAEPPAEAAEPTGGSEATIDQLDQALAAAAEEVMTAAAAAPSATVPIEAEPAAASGGEGDLEPGAPEAAAPAPAPPKSVKAVGEARPAAAAEPKEEPAVSGSRGVGGVVVAAVGPLAKLTAGLSPTVRQTVAWMSVYTTLLAMGVWGYLLVRGPAASHEPTSEPTVFLKPGDAAPAPKRATGHGTEAHGEDAHADPHAKSDGHGGDAKKAASKSDSGGHGSHGAPAKASAKAKTDSHGSSGHGSAKTTKASTSKSKSSDKKKTEAKSGGHH